MYNNEKQIRFVIDENGNKHYLEKQIGQGGQGAVWRTTDPNILVKMKVNKATGEPIINEMEYEQYCKNLDEVRVLDLPFGLHIAKPVSVLQKPFCGYTLRMLSDMKPVKYWIRPFDGEKSPIAFYRDTGGLRHRLEFLTNIAEIFAKLRFHSAVYSDLSPDNIFVSESPESCEAWLIDADNMRYRFDVRRSVMTPGYAAPEVEAGGVNTLFSDEYSFAILAHEILTMNSPFAGEKYENKGDGWDEDDEDDGFLPWIEDPEDDSNRCYTGIPGRIVMAPGLRRLFEKTFSKEGQQNPETRPSMQEWYTELRHANDLTIKCGKCGNTYIMSNHDAKCPFCNNEERKPVYYCQIIDTFDLDMLIKRANKDIDQFNEDGDFAVENIEIEDISNNKTIGMRLIDSYDGTYYLYNYHTDDIPFSFQVEPTVEIKFDNGKITLTNKSMNDMHLRSKNTDYGTIISGGSKRLDELDGLVLSMPVLYGKKEHLSEDIVVIDDITLLRTRNIRFIKL